MAEGSCHPVYDVVLQQLLCVTQSSLIVYRSNNVHVALLRKAQECHVLVKQREHAKGDICILMPTDFFSAM